MARISAGHGKAFRLKDGQKLGGAQVIAACDPATYEKLRAKGHRSCAGKLHESPAEIGVSLSYTPGPLDLFMNVPVTNNIDMTLARRKRDRPTMPCCRH